MANLELVNSLIGVKAGLGETEKTVPEILTILEQNKDIEANSWNLRDDVTITSFDFGETTTVNLAKGGEATTLTANFTTSPGGEGAYYIIIEGKKYPISKENGRVTIGKTPITTNRGSAKITGITQGNTNIATASITGQNEDKVTITPGDTKGRTTITVSSGNLTPVNLTINVLDKYTVTVVAGDNGTVSPSGVQYVTEGQSITVTATGNAGETNYKFASWSDGTTTYTTSNTWEYTPTEDVTLTATFREIVEITANDYGKKVTWNGKTDEDGTWRLYYTDEENAYLIRNSIGYIYEEEFPGFGTSTITELGMSLNKKFTENSSWDLKSDGTNINNNLKAVAALLDINNWNEYSNLVPGAKYAIRSTYFRNVY